MKYGFFGGCFKSEGDRKRFSWCISYLICRIIRKNFDAHHRNIFVKISDQPLYKRLCFRAYCVNVHGRRVVVYQEQALFGCGIDLGTFICSVAVWYFQFYYLMSFSK